MPCRIELLEEVDRRSRIIEAASNLRTQFSVMVEEITSRKKSLRKGQAGAGTKTEQFLKYIN